MAAHVLESLDVTIERVRMQGSVQIVGLGEDVASGEVPFTPRAKKVLELALREAFSLGDEDIGTEHILLGLVRENDGVAARILHDFEVDAELIRSEVIDALPERGSALEPVMPALDTGPKRSSFDFTPVEAFDLAMRLAPLSSRITFEVRSDGAEEPIFHVSCQLAGNADALRELVALEAVGIRALLESDGTVRLGHLEWPVEHGGSGGR